MFSFINASLLAALIAVIIPLLIHFFNKQRKKKIQFSSIRFLQLMEKKRLKRLKLYEYLLILLRSLIILCLVLAFARPTLTSKSLSSAHGAKTTSVIIIDNGINMRRYDEQGNRFSRAKDLLNKLQSQFKPEDKVFVIQSSNPNEISEQFINIPELNGSFKQSQWRSALTNVEKMFSDHPNYNQELFIISDFEFKENSFDLFFERMAGKRIFLLKIGTQTTFNIGIDTITIKNQIFEIKKPLKIDVGLRSSRLENTQPVEIHLFVNKQRVDHRRVSIGSLSHKIIPLSFIPNKSGQLSGYVEISDDDFLADNQYFFALNIPSKINILLVDDNPSIFIKTAQTSLTEKSNTIITHEKYSSWARQNFAQYDVLILSNFSNFSSQILQRLVKYLDNGGSLILIPGLKTIPIEFNRESTVLGITSKMKDMVRTNDHENFYTLQRPDLDHPLYNGLFRVDNPDILKPRFYRYFKYSVSLKDQQIISFQNGDPFLIQIHRKTGTIYILSSYIDDEWTDFQYRGLFIPFLSRLFYLCVSSSSQKFPSVSIGEERFISINQITNNNNYYLRSPDGEKSIIIPQLDNQNYMIKLTNLKSPGLYKILSGNDTFSIIPVNIKTQGLFEPFVQLEEIEKKFEFVKIFPEGTVFEEAIVKARLGSELWKLIILLALALLGVELLVIKLMEGKQLKK